MSASYSTPRLEGRALEHELAGDGGFVIRMKGADGKFFPISGAGPKQIRMDMRTRVAKLQKELEEQGLYTRGADSPVKLGDETRSVDLRLWSTPHTATALVEVKWTRRSLDVAHGWGWESVPWLKRACQEGVWLKGRKEVQAEVVGVLVVRPNDWRCTLTRSVGPTRTLVYPRVGEPPKRKRRSGTSTNGNLKRKRNPHLKSLDKHWRKTAGKGMTREHERNYRTTAKAKSSRKKSNKTTYQKRQG